MLIFDGTRCVDICLKNKNKYVMLAVEDMRKDFARVSKYNVMPQIIEEENEHCIIIEENRTEACEPLANESFLIHCDGNNIRIQADGYLGTMWGIYTFCEKILGMRPCYLFDDLEIQKTEKIEVNSLYLEDKPKSFGFRGVFINDEDLLTGWKDGGGIRYLDYSWYGLTVDEKVMEMVVETILRLRLNLVIPASFLNLDNPPEKLLADCVAKRGIYLSQHHLEPLGLSHFTMERYLKKYNKTGVYSYIKNPELMDEAWSYYAEKWAGYENVVWQLGLRGKIDRPVWEEDEPSKEELKQYGKLIGDAISHQKQIVMEATEGKAKYFTSTLWMEGSRLMEAEVLELPEETISIFADAGPNQMYCKEYYSVPRYDDKKYGIYYHLQYYDCGPHLAPQTGIDKLYYNLKLAYDNGDNSYCILNVSNIREFVFELNAYAEMMWDIESFDKQNYIDRYCNRFGVHSKDVKKLITDYYALLPELDVHYLSNLNAKYYNYCYDKTPDNIKNFVLKDGRILEHGRMLLVNFHRDFEGNLHKEFYDTLKLAIPKWVELCGRFRDLAEDLSEPLKRHVEVRWLCYAITLRCLYQWYISLYEAKQHLDRLESGQMKEALNIACQSLEEYLDYRKCAEYGEFKNWYRGDLKMNVKQRLYDTKMLLGQTPDFC